MPLTIQGGDIQVHDFSAGAAHAYQASVDAQLRQRAMDQQGAQHARDSYMQQQRWEEEPGREAARDERRSALELQAYQGKLSMHEQMDQQRMENQLGAIRAAIGNNQLTPEEGNNEIVRLQTGINRYQVRQQQAQDQFRAQMQGYQLQDAKHQAALQQAQEQFRAQNPSGRIQTFYHPDMMNEETNNQVAAMDPQLRQQLEYFSGPEGSRQFVQGAAQAAVARRNGTAQYLETAPGHLTQLPFRDQTSERTTYLHLMDHARDAFPMPTGLAADMHDSNPEVRRRGQEAHERIMAQRDAWVRRNLNTALTGGNAAPAQPGGAPVPPVAPPAQRPQPVGTPQPSQPPRTASQAGQQHRQAITGLPGRFVSGLGVARSGIGTLMRENRLSNAVGLTATTNYLQGLFGGE